MTAAEIAALQLWLPTIATITSGLVAALVAIAVTWLGHVFAARREAAKLAHDRTESRKALRRDKLEALVALVDEHMDYRDKQGSHIGAIGIHLATGSGVPSDAGANVGERAFDKASAIATLYFPELRAVMGQLLTATDGHLQFMASEFSLITMDSAAWRRDRMPTFGARSGEAMTPVRNAAWAVADAARKIMEEDLSI